MFLQEWVVIHSVDNIIVLLILHKRFQFIQAEQAFQTIFHTRNFVSYSTTVKASVQHDA